MSENRLLSRSHKLHIGIILTVLVTYLLTYTGFALLNGFHWANHTIAQNPVSVFFYAVVLLAWIPVYTTSDDNLRKVMKQFGWTGLILLVVGLFTNFYLFVLVEEPSLLQTSALWLSGMFSTLAFFKLIGAILLVGNSRR